MSDFTPTLPPDIPPPLPDPDAGPRPFAFGSHPNFWWAFLWCVAITLATQFPGAVAAAVILVTWMLLAPGQVPQDVTAILSHPVGQIAIGVAILVAHGLIILFSLLLLRVVAGKHWTREVAWRVPAWHHVPIVIALWPAFTVLAGGAYYVLRHVLKVPSFSDFGGGGMEEFQRAMANWPLPLGIFLIGVMPGLSEELFCRAYLGRGVVGSHGYVLGILGTSFLFGLIHVDPAQGAMAALLGVALHVVYQWTRSLWMPMLLHFLNNAGAVLLTRIPELAELDHEVTRWHLPMYAGAATVLITGLAALYLSRARLVTPPGELPWEPPFPGVACPPPDSATKVAAPWVHEASVAVMLMGLGWLLLVFGIGVVVGLKLE